MKLILTANGIQDKIGRKLIKKGINQIYGDEDLLTKTILVIHELRMNNNLAFTESVINGFTQIGFKKENITIWQGIPHSISLDEKADYLKIYYKFFDIVYVGEGLVADMAIDLRMDAFLGNISYNVNEGGLYIGSSAGAMLAGKDIYLAKYFKEEIIDVMEGVGFLGLDMLKDSAVIPHLTSSEYKTLISNLTEEEKKRYKKFYSIPDGKMLVIDNDEKVFNY